MRTLATIAAVTFLAVPVVCTAQPAMYYGFVYDARTNCGPMPVTKERFEHYQLDAKDFVCNIPKRPWVFKDSEGLTLLVLNPTFVTTYSSGVVKEINRGSGVIEIRGFTDVAAASLAATAAAAPVTHGGKAPGSVTITALKASEILSQLIDQSQMNVPLQTLVAQARDLADAGRSVDDDVREFERQMARVQAPGAPTPCGQQLGTPTATSLEACVAKLIDAIDRSRTCTALGSSGCAVDKDACVKDDPVVWSSESFVCVVQRIDLQISDLKRLRARLDEYAFPAAADRIATETEQLITKLEAFLQNLSVAETTINDFRTMRKEALDAGGTARLSGPLAVIRRSELKKQMKERYGAVLDEAELNLLADAEIKANEAPEFVERFNAATNTLQRAISTFRRQVGAIGETPPEPFPGVTVPAITNLRTMASRVAARSSGLIADVDALNQSFAALFQSINGVYFTFRDTKHPINVPLDLKDGSGNNRIVYAAVSSSEKFSPYRFDVVSPVLPPAPGVQVGMQTPLFAAPANAGLGVNPAGLTQAPDRPFDFEMHQFWRANIVSGIAFSGISKNDYAVRTRQKTVNGQPQVQSDGQPENESYIAAAGTQSVTAHYFLGFNFYPGHQDTFPGARVRWWNAVGILGGVALDEAQHYFIGMNYEPVIGVDVAAGLHWGRKTVLQDGYQVGDVVPSGDPPTRDEMQGRLFVMVGFDLKIFRAIFGGPTSVPH